MKRPRPLLGALAWGLPWALNLLVWRLPLRECLGLTGLLAYLFLLASATQAWLRRVPGMPALFRSRESWCLPGLLLLGHAFMLATLAGVRLSGPVSAACLLLPLIPLLVSRRRLARAGRTLLAAGSSPVYWCVLLVLCYYSLTPHQVWGEKLMDVSLLGRLSGAVQGLPEDPWLAGQPLRYYFGSYLLWGRCAQVFFADPVLAYLPLFALFPALMLLVCREIFRAAGAGRAFSLLAAASLGFGSHVYSLILLAKGAPPNLDTFWKLSRMFGLGGEIWADTPGWTFAYYDFHANGANLIWLVLCLAVLLRIPKARTPRASLLLGLGVGLCFSWSVIANTWDAVFLGPVLTGLALLVPAPRRGYLVGFAAGGLPLGLAYFHAISGPGTAGLSWDLGAQIGKPSILLFVGQWLLVALLALAGRRRNLRSPDWGLVFGALCLLGLVGQVSLIHRGNSVYRALGFAWVLLGVGSWCAFFNGRPRQWTGRIAALLALLMLVGGGYGWLARRGTGVPWSERSLSLLNGIDQELPGFLAARALLLALEDGALVLERPVDSYDTSSQVLSNLAYRRCYLGWMAHLAMRQADLLEIQRRVRCARRILAEGPADMRHALLRAEGIDVVVLGPGDRGVLPAQVWISFAGAPEHFQPLLVQAQGFAIYRVLP